MCKCILLYYIQDSVYPYCLLPKLCSQASLVPCEMQYGRDCGHLGAERRANANADEKKACAQRSFPLLARSTGKALQPLEDVMLWACTVYAYTLCRIISRYLSDDRRKIKEGWKLEVSYNGVRSANGLPAIVKQVLNVIFMRNYWADYYRDMRRCRFGVPASAVIPPHHQFFRIILRDQLHDTRKPFYQEILLAEQRQLADVPEQGGLAESRSSTEDELLHTRTDAEVAAAWLRAIEEEESDRKGANDNFVCPQDAMWAALLRVLVLIEGLQLPKHTRCRLAVVFLILTTRTRSPLLIEGASELVDNQFARRSVEDIVTAVSQHLGCERFAHWKTLLKVKDYTVNTCGVKSSSKRFIFSGVTTQWVESLLDNRVLTTTLVGMWSRKLPGHGHFIAQHMNVNFFQVSLEKDISFVPHKQAQQASK